MPPSVAALGPTPVAGEVTTTGGEGSREEAVAPVCRRRRVLRDEAVVVGRRGRQARQGLRDLHVGRPRPRRRGGGLRAVRRRGAVLEPPVGRRPSGVDRAVHRRGGSGECADRAGDRGRSRGGGALHQGGCGQGHDAEAQDMAEATHRLEGIPRPLASRRQHVKRVQSGDRCGSSGDVVEGAVERRPPRGTNQRPATTAATRARSPDPSSPGSRGLPERGRAEPRCSPAPAGTAGR